MFLRKGKNSIRLYKKLEIVPCYPFITEEQLVKTIKVIY